MQRPDLSLSWLIAPAMISLAATAQVPPSDPNAPPAPQPFPSHTTSEAPEPASASSVPGNAGQPDKASAAKSRSHKQTHKHSHNSSKATEPTDSPMKTAPSESSSSGPPPH